MDLWLLDSFIAVEQEADPPNYPQGYNPNLDVCEVYKLQ